MITSKIIKAICLVIMLLQLIDLSIDYFSYFNVISNESLIFMMYKTH